MAEPFVRVGCNISEPTAATIKTLMESRDISLGEVIRRAVAVLKFVEDEIAAGGQLAVVEADRTVRMVELLP